MIALDLCKMFPLSDCTVHAFVQLKKIIFHFIENLICLISNHIEASIMDPIGFG